MAEMVFDRKHGETAAEILSDIMNGAMPQSVQATFEVAKNLGEDNPVVEAIQGWCRGYESMFNDQVLPLANKIHANMMAHAEFAALVNNVQVGKVQGPGDLGSVADNNYDAAKNL